MSDRSVQEAGNYVAPRVEHARVADAMRHGVLSCSSNSSLRAAARTMTLHHIHTVVVNSAGDGSLLGILSDGELVSALLQPDAGDHTVGDVARREVTTLSSDQSLSEAVRSMRAGGSDHAIVVDAHSGHPTGMLSTLDVLGVFAGGEA